MPWTTHGYWYGTGLPTETSTQFVVRCGGPGLCGRCAREAAATPKPVTEPTTPERHEPHVENACGTEQDYGSGLIHVCRTPRDRCAGTHTCDCGLIWTPTTPPLRGRYDAAMRAHYIDTSRRSPDGHNPCICGNWWDDTMSEGWDEHLADAVLAVRDEELELHQIRAAGAERRNAELLRIIARLRQMADAWERKFPEVIRTDVAAEAIRMATEQKGITS